MTDPVLERYAALDAGTRSTVDAVVGKLPEVPSAEELERLGAAIDAVEAGTRAARAEVAAAAVSSAEELPDPLPPSAGPLRARVRALDPSARDAMFVTWRELGLPDLADAEGNDAVLDEATHRRIEALIASAEAPVGMTEEVVELLEAWRALPAGQRLEVDARLSAQGLRDVWTNPALITAGRVETLRALLEAVEEQAAQVVAEALGPVREGRIVSTPVDGADELELVPPDGKAADVEAWVGGDPVRARAALDAEQARPKPRKGLLAKLAPLAGGPATPPPPPPASRATAPASGAASGEEGSPADPAAEVSVPSAEPSVEAPDAGAPLATVTPIGAAAIDPEVERQSNPDPDAKVPLIELPPADLADWPPLKAAAFLGRLGAELVAAGRLLEQWATQAKEVAR